MPVVGGNAIDHNVAYPGLALTFEVNNKKGKLNATSAIIPFGKGVVTDTLITTTPASRLPVLADVNALAFNGVAFYELNRAYQDGETIGATVGYDFTVLSAGEIWVITQIVVAVDDPVYLITDDAGASSNEGDFINVAASGNYTGLLIPNAKFTSAAAAPGDLVKIAFTIGG
jgi:hypothetical protein